MTRGAPASRRYSVLAAERARRGARHRLPTGTLERAIPRLHARLQPRRRAGPLHAAASPDTARRAIRVAAAAAALYRPLADSALAFLQSQRDGPETILGAMHRRPSHLSDASASVYRMPSYRGTTLPGARPHRRTRRRVGRLVRRGRLPEVRGDRELHRRRIAVHSARIPRRRLRPGGAARRGASRHRLAAEDVGPDPARALLPGRHRRRHDSESILGDHDLWRLPQADERGNAKPGIAGWYCRPPARVRRERAGSPDQPQPRRSRGRRVRPVRPGVRHAATPPTRRAACSPVRRSTTRPTPTPARTLLTSVPHAYYTEPEWRDDMALGAVELYLATQRLASSPTVQAQARRCPTPTSATTSPAPGSGSTPTSKGSLSGEDSLNLYDVSTLAGHDIAQILRTPLGRACRGPTTCPPTVPALLEDRHDQLHLAERLARQEPFGLANPSTNLDTVAHALGYAVRGAHLRHTGGHRRIRVLRPEPARLGARRKRLGHLVRGRRRIGLPALSRLHRSPTFRAR